MTLPHIFLLGSTGRTGRLLLTEALSRGHTVTALARDPASLQALVDELSGYQRKLLNISKGTPTSQSDLEAALGSALASTTKPITIISTLGQTRKSGSPFAAPTSPPLYMTQSITSLLAAIGTLPAQSRSRIEKLVIMSMFGAGSSYGNLHCLIKPVMKYSAMAQTVEDHDALDALVRGQSEVPWVMVRPAMLKDGEPKAAVIREDDGRGEGWMPSSVTTGTVVTFMLDAVVSRKFDGKTPVLCN